MRTVIDTAGYLMVSPLSDDEDNVKLKSLIYLELSAWGYIYILCRLFLMASCYKQNVRLRHLAFTPTFYCNFVGGNFQQ
jgi:hypothetical protein